MLCVRIVNIFLVLGLANANNNNNNNNVKPKYDVDQFIKHIIDAEIWSKLHYKSVYINEIEKIDLKPFLSDITLINKKNLNRVLMGIIAGLKCQCAHSIGNSLEYAIQNVMTQQHGSMIDDRDDSSPKPEFWKSGVGMSYFKIIHDTIALTIDIIFQINDIIPNLKSNEPSFLKQLLSIHLYFNKLIRFHNDMNENNRHLVDNDDLFMTNSVQVHYMISQMMNLLHGFKVLNCDSRDTGTYNEIHLLNELLVDLMDLKARLQSFPSNNLYTTEYNVDDAMLTDLIGDPMAGKLNSENIPTEKKMHFSFIDYLMKANVKNLQDHGAVSIQYLFNHCTRTYDIEVLYKYLSSIYDVLLKIIYQQINKLIVKIIEDKSSDFNAYSGSLKKLIEDVLYFPIDIISDVKFLLKFNIKNIFKATKIVENRLKSLSHIQIPELSEFTLNEIAIIIGDSNFQQFWRVFCSLRFAEARKNSDYVYETSLKLISNSILNGNDNHLNYTLNYECTTLNNIYYNYFRINIMIENYYRYDSQMPNLTKYYDIFSKIHKYSLDYSNHLTEVIKVWFQSKNLNFSDDLLKILMITLIRLKNINFYIDHFSRMKKNTIQTDILTNNIENLRRIGDYVMHLLDNYQICNCKTTNNHNLNYEYFKKNQIFYYDIYNSLLMFNIPIITSSIDQDPDYNMVLENTEESRSIQYLPKKWYRLLFFIEKNTFFSCKIMKLFAENIRFNWNGVVSSIRDQINLLKTTLSLNYLVEYVSNYFKFIFSSMYFALINLFNNPLAYKDDLLDRWHLADNLTNFTSLEFPENCKPYIDVIKNICSYQTIDSSLAKEIENSMLAEIEKSGIVDVDQTLQNIKEKIKSDGSNYIVFISTVITETETFISVLQKYVDK